jgi:hypothetical protein
MSAQDKVKAQQYRLVEQTPIVYPCFFKKSLDDARARGVKLKGYGGLLLIKPGSADATGITNLLKEMINTKWGANKPANIRLPLKNGDKFADAKAAKGKSADWARENLLLTVKKPDRNQKGETINPPEVYAAGDRTPKMDPMVIPDGAIVRAELAFLPYDGNDEISPGITCYVNNVMVFKVGPRITGRDIMEAYGVGVKGQDTDHNPMDGLDL